MPSHTRRVFLIGAAAALCARPAHAQQPRPRIGWISTDKEPDPFLEGFREGLRQYSWIDGQNVEVVVRYGNVDQLRGAVAELKDKVAFLVAAGPAIRAVRGTKDVAALFAVSGDPVEAQLADSVAHPGRNFSGISFMSLDVAAKRVQLLKEAIPGLRTVALLSNVDHPGESSERKVSESAARDLGITPVYVPFNAITEFDQGLRGVANAKADAVIVFPEGVTVAHRAKVATFAVAQKLPSMFGWSEYVDAGGLMSYGANVREAYVHLGRYADRLLRGAKVSELPIVQPTRFELVVNANTAKLLGLAIPQTITMRAARLIE
jgi:ABC-type uncharacterized transport system substrate-binding protein